MKAIIILLKYIYLMFQVYKGTEYFRNIMENREKNHLNYIRWQNYFSESNITRSVEKYDLYFSEVKFF